MTHSNDLYPEWVNEESKDMLNKSYIDDLSRGLRGQFERMAKTASKWAPKDGTDWESKFFDMFWKGWYSNSTPAYNLGNRRAGLPVSCSSSYIPDNLNGIYKAKHEIAMLTRNGFGCAAHLDDVRPRGSMVAGSFKSTGVLPIIQGLVQDLSYVCQGAKRRGSIAFYLDVCHGDAKEVCIYLKATPKDFNMGWNFKEDDFIRQMDSGNLEYLEKWQMTMGPRFTSGKGYHLYLNKANRKLPECYKREGLEIKGNNLCNELVLPTSDEYTFNCTLGSLNIAKYDEWKDTDLIKTAMVYLDCINSEFLDAARGIEGLEKIVKFAERFRPVGLGLMGLHTYMQDNMMAWGSYQSIIFNLEIAKKMDKESLEASQWLSKELGEPEGCKGLGIRMGSRLAIAPTKSSSNLMGGQSQGCEQMFGACFSEPLSTGFIIRDNPAFVRLLNKKGLFSRELMNDIAINYNGSVQHLDFLTNEEKLVFRAVWETNPYDVLKMASMRQKYLDQTQSLNLVFGPKVTEEEISAVHEYAMRDPEIISLYYMRRITEDKGGIQQDLSECLACQ